MPPEEIARHVALKTTDFAALFGYEMFQRQLGCRLECWQLEDLDSQGAALAALTHGHPLGYLPAAVLTHIVNRITYAKTEFASLQEIVRDAIQAVQGFFPAQEGLAYMVALLEKAMELSTNGANDATNISLLGAGWVAEETLAIAVYCALRHAADFSAGIIAAVNHDGDSDSTGSVTGNILGAWLGYAAISEQWKQDLELAELILEVADDLSWSAWVADRAFYSFPAWQTKYVLHQPYYGSAEEATAQLH